MYVKALSTNTLSLGPCTNKRRPFVFLGFANAHHFDVSSAHGVSCLPSFGSEAHFPHQSSDLVSGMYTAVLVHHRHSCTWTHVLKQGPVNWRLSSHMIREEATMFGRIVYTDVGSNGFMQASPIVPLTRAAMR
jgi:hypothetical protein